MKDGRSGLLQRLDQFGELIGLVSGFFNEASSDDLMLLDAMATSGVNKLDDHDDHDDNDDHGDHEVW